MVVDIGLAMTGIDIMAAVRGMGIIAAGIKRCVFRPAFADITDTAIRGEPDCFYVAAPVSTLRAVGRSLACNKQ
jgi:hypothetical protein